MYRSIICIPRYTRNLYALCILHRERIERERGTEYRKGRERKRKCGVQGKIVSEKI